MRILYLDLGMGAAGDMLSASLLDLLPNPEEVVERLNRMGIPGVTYEYERVNKSGISGASVHVKVNGAEEGHSHHEGHDHHHRTLQEIQNIVENLDGVEKAVKDRVLAVYNLLAEAEGSVHGTTVSEVHFHEVGALDAIADITAVCMLLEEINPEKIIASSVHVGSGSVRCAHGVMPVPAPATALLLKDIPMYGGKIEGELCTPTGAALIKTFVNEFAEMSVMKVSAIGYGMGKKKFERVNCVRAMLGEALGSTDTIIELTCTLDDMTGEKVGFAKERIFDAGALDVYTFPVNMKKNRPGICLTVLCNEEKKNQVVEAVFKHTTTIGLREQKLDRYVLDRREETVDTVFGKMRRKCVSGYGVSRYKWEYEDLKKVALDKGLSLREVEEELERTDK